MGSQQPAERTNKAAIFFADAAPAYQSGPRSLKGDKKISDLTLAWNPWLVSVRHHDGEVEVRHGFRSLTSFVLHDSARPAVLANIIDNVQAGPTSRAHLIAVSASSGQAEYCADLVDELVESGLLLAVDEDPINAYYRFIQGHKPDVYHKVSIIGDGAFAMDIAETFANTPVAVQSIDISKSLAELEANIQALQAADVDLAILALDRHSPLGVSALNSWSIQTLKPSLTATFDGSEVTLGTLYVPGVSACHAEAALQSQAAAIRPGAWHAYQRHLDAGVIVGAPVPLPLRRLASGLLVTTLLSWFATGLSTLTRIHRRSWSE